MTKENSLSETEREINGSTNPLTEHYSVNECYMFITILEVLMDQAQTKVMTLKYYLAFIKINNLSNLQKPERQIARISRNSNGHYFYFQIKLNQKVFSEYQDTRIQSKSNKPDPHESHTAQFT